MCTVAACGGSPDPVAPVAVEPAVDGRKAERDAKGLVTEIYGAISRGNTDSLFSLLSDPITVFGPRRVDAMVTRADALVALGKVVDPRAKRRLRLHSGGLAVIASQGGRSAWAADVINFEGQPLAVTAVLSNSDDLWAVTAVALAETPTGKQVKAESARDAIVPPGGAAAGKLDPSASAAVEKFKKDLLDQQSWGDELASWSDAVVIGPTAGDVSRGKQAIKRLWRARMKANVREAISGEITAAMTPDGQLVWISAPVTRVADGEDPLPLRIFAVYENHGTEWNMIALHEAVALDEPGSGTAFKKVLPPAPAPEPEPAKVEPKDPKPASTAKKKPRPKKKRRPRAD